MTSAFRKGIVVDPSAESLLSYASKQVVAQDPAAPAAEPLPTPEEALPDAAPDDMEAEEEPKGPSKEEMVKEIEDSPPTNWQKYLQPILLDIGNILHVPIELHNSYMVPVGTDPDLGFKITGVVHFTETVPDDVEALLKGRVLRYEAYVDPDGKLSKDVDLLYPTDRPEYVPTYHGRQNVYSL